MNHLKVEGSFCQMDIMKPIPRDDVPLGEDWLYEVKYDGFRCVLHWNKNGEINLISKNNKDLTKQFPEIVSYCMEYVKNVKNVLPIKLDGELVILNNSYQANFSQIQRRGRLKSKHSIQNASKERPATLLVFDILEIKGTDLTRKDFTYRKKSLSNFFDTSYISRGLWNPLGMVEAFQNPNELWRIIFEHKGEGMVAKRKKSSYIKGKGHQDWFKIKNWRLIHGILTSYDNENGYFDVQVLDDNKRYAVGKCKHGLNTEDMNTVKNLFINNGEKHATKYHLPPAVCAEIHTLDIYEGELREPEFKRIAPELKPEDCTLEMLQQDLAMLPKKIDFANTDKLYWPDAGLTKGNFLAYIREISPYMLPFLKNRPLTTIRCPDGVDEESFFQKHLPPYAPDFIEGYGTDEEKLILCDSLESLLWFANHGALEFHVPFQDISSNYPKEIVFDLDPPDRGKFSWAVQAGLLIKKILDDLQLISFVKTSGNKGLQVHIPIPEGSMSYEETGVFTQAIAYTLESQQRDIFTTERMKDKRNGRLYIDYVQHGRDKTLIAPYSTRRTPEGTVATPLFWEEVTMELRPEMFTIKNVVDRVQRRGCPFRDYFAVGKNQQLNQVLSLMQ